MRSAIDLRHLIGNNSSAQTGKSTSSRQQPIQKSETDLTRHEKFYHGAICTLFWISYERTSTPAPE